MSESIIQLYPFHSGRVPLKDLYVQNPHHEISLHNGGIYIYSNFIVSLDGRIAVSKSSVGRVKIPDVITNSRDWRLVQELSVQADLLITSGRYLRGYTKGGGQKILHTYDDPEFADLKEKREANGLKPWPDLAVVSNSLDFTVPQEVLTHQGRTFIVITSQNADPDRIQRLESEGAKVLVSGEKHVEGRIMADGLTALGYQRVYSITGPKVLHLLLEGDVLNRLFLTLAPRILGGTSFSSIAEGEYLDPPRDFQLKTLYLDPDGLDGLGQLFACYDRIQKP